MSTTVDGSNTLSDASIALELLNRAKQMKRKNKRKSVAEAAAEKTEQRTQERMKAANEALQKAYQVKEAPGTGGKEERINLSALFSRLKQINENPDAARQAAKQSTEKVEINYEQRTTEIEVSINVNRYVAGLERINENLAQTDRYLFEFRDGATFTIKDKWANKSTTIWGDPHVDVDDVDGNMDGDFKDLTASERITTFMLQDGTRLTITALDTGIIEKIDIFNGSQHLQGTGAGSSDWEQSQLFDKEVQYGDGYESTLERGDVIKAGGDGNDWYNESGLLVWGKTTGALTYTRPTTALEVKIKQTVEQFSFFQQVDRWT